jgi:RHS repeat-associated protein
VGRGKANLVSTQSYDTTGQILQFTDPNQHITSYSYADSFLTDNNANPPASYTPATPTNAYQTTTTFPNNQKITKQYYFNTGNLAATQDENSQVRYNHYIDPIDRLTTAWSRLISGTSNRGWKNYAYPSATQVNTTVGITSTSPTGCTGCRQDSVTYDTFGRQNRATLVSDPDGQTFVDTTYDTSSRRHSDSNPYRSTSDSTYGIITYAYDGMNRQVSMTNPDGNIKGTYYGATVGSNGGASSQLCASSTYGLGYPTLTVDEAGRKSQSWVDGFGRTIESDEPDSNNNLTLATCYQYNLQDQVTQIVQGSQTRTRAYDSVPRITSSTDPESGTTQFFYLTSSLIQCSGNTNNICYQTDARGVTTTFTYDSRDRLTSKTYSDTTPTETYYFDQTSYNNLTITNGAGRMTGMNDGSGQTAWSYDGEGDILAEQQTISGVTKGTTYTYNLDKSVATMTYPSGMAVTYAYNNAQRQTSVTDTTNPSSPLNYVSSATYAPQGAPASAVMGQISGGFGGITESSTYNNRLQPVNHIASSSNGTVLNHTYSFNVGNGANNGSVASITNNLDTGRTQTFTYDNMNRLATAQSQATSGADCWGQSYTYDRYGNLTNANVTQCSAPSLSLTVNSSNNQITNTGVTYDAAGNMTNDGSQAYTWDGAGRLKSAAGVANVFDGNYLRVSQSSQLFWYKVASCGHELMGRSGSTGTYDTEFIYFNGRQVAYKDDTGGHVYYYVNDHLGSSRVMTDSSGVTQFDSDYYPFGGQRSVVGNEDSPLKFNGKWRDSTGVDNSFRRFYDPALGRWLSPDPVWGRVGVPSTNNLYPYVVNDPLDKIDPRGTLHIEFLCITFTIPCFFPPNNLALCAYWQGLLQAGDLCDKSYAAAALPACLRSGLSCFARCMRFCTISGDPLCRQKFPQHTLDACGKRDKCRAEVNGICTGGCFFELFAGRRFTICIPILVLDDCDFGGCGSAFDF